MRRLKAPGLSLRARLEDDFAVAGLTVRWDAGIAGREVK
jgi:hypothetical protein